MACIESFYPKLRFFCSLFKAISFCEFKKLIENTPFTGHPSSCKPLSTAGRTYPANTQPCSHRLYRCKYMTTGVHCSHSAPRRPPTGQRRPKLCLRETSRLVCCCFKYEVLGVDTILIASETHFLDKESTILLDDLNYMSIAVTIKEVFRNTWKTEKSAGKQRRLQKHLKGVSSCTVRGVRIWVGIQVI